MKVTKKHAVMMEYVIIAVLVAAAVVVAVIMFGRTISAEMNVATQSMVDAKAAADSQEQFQKDTKGNLDEAQSHTTKMHNYDQGNELKNASGSK